MLMDDDFQTLFLADADMMRVAEVFEERGEEGWSGNGYDWTSVARVVVDERLPHLAALLDYDPEAGMFSAKGPSEALDELGRELVAVYHDKKLLRDFLSRAELD